MEIIFEIEEILVCVLEAYLMFDFFVTFFSLRKNVQWRYTKVTAVVITAVCVSVVNSLNNPTINIVAMQIIYLSLLFLLFTGRILKKLFYYLIATAMMIGSEFIWIVLMSLPTGLVFAGIQNNRISMYIALLGVKTIAFILFNVVKRITRVSNSRMDIKTLLLYSIVPISTLGIMMALASLDIDFDSLGFVQVMLVICSALVVVGNILIFYIFDRYIASLEQLLQQNLRISKMELEEKRYEQIEVVNREHAVFLHDIRHYMHTIGELAVEHQESEILKLLSELQIKVSEAETEMYCPNRMLNTILNEKKKEAVEKCIEMSITIEPEFVVDQIENTDLVVIMGNLLDNAVEAAYKCMHGYVKVYLYTQNEAQFSVIKIENNYIGEIVIENDIILTSKKDKTRHGFGVQSVKTTIEKYKGYLYTIYKDGMFTAVAILPNEIIS